MLRILIADDHPIVRRGLKQLLIEEPDVAEVGEASDGQQALQLVADSEWDVLVLDLNMPGRDGLEVLAEVRRRRPKLPVLVLSMYPEEQFALRVMKAGAAGYLTKESATEELVKAVRKVHGRGKYVSPSLAETLASALRADPDQLPHLALSNREFQVLRLIASGKVMSEVAKELHLSVKTVSTYRSRVLEKMGLGSNAELTRYAFQHRLID